MTSSRRARRHLALALGLAALTGAACTKTSTKYCALNPEDERCAGVAPDAPLPGGCQLDADCTEPGLGVCAAEVCVQCTAARPEACTGTTPVCGDDQACRACAAHDECPSQVCTPEGRCLAEADVAYVVEDATGTACTPAEPCGNLEDAIDAARPAIKVTGMIEEPGLVLLDGVTVTIYGALGALVRSRGDTLLDVRGDTGNVVVRDLILTGTTDASKPVVRLSGGGRLALEQVTIRGGAGRGLVADSGALRITRSVFLQNSQGGLEVTGVTTTFDVTASVFAYNGDARTTSPSPVGGAAVIGTAAGSRFAFNTVAFNLSGNVTYRGGAHCSGASVDATGNLLYRNGETTGPGGGVTYSLATQRNEGGLACPWGTTYALDTHPDHLGFQSPLAAPYDFHLTAATPAEVIDQGGACTGADLDGEARFLGAGCDRGADEAR